MTRKLVDVKDYELRVNALEKNFEALVTLVQAFGDRVKELDTFLRQQVEKAQVQ
jgi:hypothetical protein